MMTTVFIGDVGTEIILDCGVDISAATVRRIMVKDPQGTARTWNAVAEGTNSIKYVTVADDLNIPGVWKVQAYVEMPVWKGHGNTSTFNVNRLI